MKPHIDPESNPTVAHEETDANARSVTAFGIAIVFTIIACQLLLWLLFRSFSSHAAKSSPHESALIRQQAPRQPPEPRLQGNPPLDLRKMRDEEDAVLNNYDWVDRPNGVVRIPISRAIEIAAQKGLQPVKVQGETLSGSTPTRPNPGDTGAGSAFGGAKKNTPR